MYSVRLVMMMETEEETINQFKDLMEPDEHEEEVEQLEEMRLPVLTSWMGPDGITVPGIMCVDDGIIGLMNRSQFIDCSICLEPSSAHGGKHRICCLPCGHMYGLSCIKKWLLQHISTRKCPQCNTSCSFQDTILLYPPASLSVTHHQQASSSLSTAFFPFTKQGARAFKKYEISRAHDVQQLQHNDKICMNILLTRANELEAVTRSLQSRASPLGQRFDFDALKRRIDSLKRLASAFRQRIDALGQRYDTFKPRIKFYLQMYKEHHKKKQLAERAKEKAKKKGKEAAEKKLKEKEKKDKKKMQASAATVDVPEEEMVEDVAYEPEEDKVEVQAKPTTKTTERVRVRSRINKGLSLNSISKGILKHKKSNNYMYYYAAGAVAVLTAPLALGYTLYA